MIDFITDLAKVSERSLSPEALREEVESAAEGDAKSKGKKAAAGKGKKTVAKGKAAGEAES